MTEMTVGAAAKAVGLRPSAIRYYESVGILPPPRRVSGQRRYDASVLDCLRAIQVAKEAGFTIGEIRRLFRGFPLRTSPSARWRALARQKLREVDDMIARALGMKRMLEDGLRCGCLTLEDCRLLARSAKLSTGARRFDRSRESSDRLRRSRSRG